MGIVGSEFHKKLESGSHPLVRPKNMYITKEPIDLMRQNYTVCSIFTSNVGML
jgi:hypothetical protein